MKNILCPVDFSEDSKLAAEWAARIALKRNANVILFNKFLVLHDKSKSTENLFTEAKKEVEQKLGSMREDLCKISGPQNLQCDIQTVYGIDVDEMVLNAAKENAADLIVMGTEGAKKFSDIIFGSNASHVIENSQIPVVVVPASSTQTIPNTILYSTDLKNENPEIVTYVLDFAAELDANVIFLHVNVGTESKLAELKTFFSDIITSKLHRWDASKISYEEVKSKDVFSEIQEYAEKKGAGMIALGNHRKNLFEKLMKGDFTRLMSLYSNKPLLILQKNK